MKKRIVSLLLACFLAASMVVPAQASSASLSGSSAAGAGGAVVLTLSVSDTILGFQTESLSYSSNLTLSSWECLVSGWDMAVGGTNFSAYNASKSAKGAVMKLTFKISGSAKTGDALSVKFGSVTGTDGNQDIEFGAASWTGAVAAPPSGNCDLDLIMCTSGTLVPAFNKNTTHYTVTVPYSVEKLALDYNRADKGQMVTIDGNSNLVVGENTITLTVRAASGATKVYTIVATREQDPNYVPSDDATLKEMTVEGATLSPAFDPQITEYVAYIPFEQNSLTIRGVANDEKAYTVQDEVVELDRAENIPAFLPEVDEETGMTLPVTTYAAEAATGSLTCTAEDGVTKMTYTVHVVRMPAYTGGVPQIHMTNEADLAEEVPEEEKPIDIPRTLDLPLVGEVNTVTVAVVGGSAVAVVMVLLGFLLGRIGRRKVVYEDDYDDEDEEMVDEPIAPVAEAAPAKPEKAPQPERPAKPEKPAKQDKPAKADKPAPRAKAFDFDEEEDEFERLLESAPVIEHKLPERPVEIEAAPAEPELPPEEAPIAPADPVVPADLADLAAPADPAEEEVLSHMSLDDLLDDIRNM